MSDLRNVLLILDPGESYDAALLRGITAFSISHRRWRIFRPPPFWESDQGWDGVEFARRCRADGLILIERPDLHRFGRLKIPMVVSPYRSSSIEGCANILTDHPAVGRMAAEHCLERGFQHFAFCGHPEMFWSVQRGDGFCSELEESGHRVLRFNVTTGTGYIKGEERLKTWLRRLPKPCVVFAAIDSRALQIGELCSLMGIAVPEEVAIIGVNNDSLLCSLAPTPITSVAISAEKAGREAAEALDGLMRSRRSRSRYPRIVVRPTHVEARASTDFRFGRDPVVVKALEMIRQSADGKLDVATVARLSGVSRRTIEIRFQQVLSRSVYKEIRRSRVEVFSRLLRESNLTISEIGDRLGFPSPAHVARVFRDETGMSPSEYRRLSSLRLG
jgi:LacI family transcriptional regulator